MYSTIQTPVVSAAAKSTVNYYQWTVLQDIDAIFAPHFNSHRILVYSSTIHTTVSTPVSAAAKSKVHVYVHGNEWYRQRMDINYTAHSIYTECPKCNSSPTTQGEEFVNTHDVIICIVILFWCITSVQDSPTGVFNKDGNISQHKV